MTTMTLEQIQAERAAFEVWARREGYAVEAMDMRDDGTYHGIGARNAWSAWQARAHLAQPAQAVDVGAIREVAFWLTSNSHWVTGAYDQGQKLTRALSGEKAGPVGDGWDLVPCEPTQEMLDAFQEELCRWSALTRVDDAATAALWKSMLAANKRPPEVRP